MRIQNDFFKRMCGMRRSALLLLVSESPMCTGCALADCKQAAEEQQATRRGRKKTANHTDSRRRDLYFLDYINRGKKRQKQRAERSRRCSTYPAFHSSWKTEIKTTLVGLHQSQAEDSLRTRKLFFFYFLCFSLLFCFLLAVVSERPRRAHLEGLKPPRGRGDIPVYSLGTYRRRPNPQRSGSAARSQVDFACSSLSYFLLMIFYFPRIH